LSQQKYSGFGWSIFFVLFIFFFFLLFFDHKEKITKEILSCERIDPAIRE